MNIKQVKKWNELFKKKYGENFKILQIENLSNDYKLNKKLIENFKNIKSKFYDIVMFEEVKTINLNSFKTWYNGLNTDKLDAFLFNELSNRIGYDIYEMSLKEKCRIFFNEYEYKLIIKYFIN